MIEHLYYYQGALVISPNAFEIVNFSTATGKEHGGRVGRDQSAGHLNRHLGSVTFEQEL